MKKPIFDVVIVGGGVSGTALLYELSRFTNLDNIALIEKYPVIASVNSHSRNNSQTLHCGDIETNYTLEKAIHVRDTAKMVVNYASQLTKYDHILFRYPKMVLAVGDEECGQLQSRFETFKQHFPAMQWLDGGAIETVEPRVMQGRKETAAAIGSMDEFCAVDFQQLSNSFVDEARKAEKTKIDLMLSTKVKNIEKKKELFQLETNQGTIKSRFVVVSTGGHSLLSAQRMGYGLNYSCLPVAGSFYFTPKVLNGKVYTMQNDKLPFAAIHGDPDVLVPDKSRFGPTALILPLLERYNWKTFPEFMRVVRPDKAVFRVFWDLFRERDIRNYMLKNMFFELPVIRRHLFLKDLRKIVPSMNLEDLKFAHHVGGIRPVMIDKVNAKLHLGEAKINPGNGIIFNMTPSPGATSCLGNAEVDLKVIVDYLQCDFNAESFHSRLKG